MAQPLVLRPTLEEVSRLLLDTAQSTASSGGAVPSTSAPTADHAAGAAQGNIVPVYASLPADLLTPVMAYLRLSGGSDTRRRSFLCESVTNGEKIGRWSFVGADPYKVVRTGANTANPGDPLAVLEKELSPFRYISLPNLPRFTGGAMGYISYDAIAHFEPRTARPMKDVLGVPEAIFMLCNDLIAFDHTFQSLKVISHVHLPDDHASRADKSTASAEVQRLYARAALQVQALVERLLDPVTPLPKQRLVRPGTEAVSNVGREGYVRFVRELRKHIIAGDIIQAVPSQRLSRRTDVHPFNVYRHLRSVNPSPYMFYLDVGDARLVGASPETLCKVEQGRVAVHAIAGTVKRGASEEEDKRLAEELLASAKDQAEHVMLVDLARNDVSRVCDPHTTTVESFMRVEKFSHVMHLTSRITGFLRQGKSRFDALRSIFPAGTVSGAPKIRAIELVSELEGERRGVYAGAVGHIDYSDDMDVCIAIRTMCFLPQEGQDETESGSHTAYLQAGE
ncbi:anthranilate synthase component [Ceraceosorus bombacis]|uniref:Anthranilate synthase component n=1 Tax=Ceraceosorus bombacis TaxID=401625 RepID=A0A0P1BBK9_9BASI|nr:anthranilate synthase component [Ceraceosorus bombacis]